MYPEEKEKEEDYDIVGGIDIDKTPWYLKLILLLAILIPIGLLGFIIWGIYKIITI